MQQDLLHRRLFVDLSGLAHRAAHKLGDLGTAGASTGIVYGVLKSLHALAAELQPAEIVLCLDRGHVDRTALYPQYKANRKRDDAYRENYNAQMLQLERVLALLPVTCVYQSGVEADDVIAALVRFTKLERTAIVTGDHDLYQLTAPPQCVMLDYHGYPTELAFDPPRQIVTYKVLVGDTSDNIKGVTQLGDVKARELLRKYKTLKRIMRAAKAGKAKLGNMSYVEALPIVRRNLRLVRLDGKLCPATGAAQMYAHARTRRELKLDELRAVLTELGFTKTVRTLGAFAQPFESLQRQPPGYKAEQKQHEQKQSDKPHGAKSQSMAKAAEATSERGQARRARIVRKVRWGVQATDDDRASAGRSEHKARAGANDSPSQHPRVEGAVRPSVVERARARRAGELAAGLPRGEEVRRSDESLRRERALSIMSSLNWDRGWVRQQNAETLSELMRLSAKLEAAPKTARVSEAELKLVEAVHSEWLMELPKWAE